MSRHLRGEEGKEISPPPTHSLCLYHVAHGLVECVDLVRLKVADDGSDVVEYLFYKRHHFLGLDLSEAKEKMIKKERKKTDRIYPVWTSLPSLPYTPISPCPHLDKMPAALLSDLDEGVTGHVLNPVVRFLEGTEEREEEEEEQTQTTECARRKTDHTYTKQRLHLLTMHEFKQLVHNCLQKLPVSPEKERPNQRKNTGENIARLLISF